jgi:hypothetical protein
VDSSASSHPSALQKREDGAAAVIGLVSEMIRFMRQDLHTQNYLRIQRGPFVVASVLDESVSEEPLRLQGVFVDLFDPALPVISERVLKPGERMLVSDLNWFNKNGIKAKVVAAGARVKREKLEDQRFEFTVRGPKATRGNACVLVPKQPSRVTSSPELAIASTWHPESATVLLSFENVADDVTIRLEW